MKQIQQFGKLVRLSRRDGITLIEILIVVGVISVLSTASVAVFNPVELNRKANDVTRLSDLQTIDRAIRNLTTFNTNIAMGSSTVVYVSLPDSSPTCASWNLPALPTGWTYGCVATSTYRNVHGTGWVPVNLVSREFPLSHLPEDPKNTTSSGNYYTFTALNGLWELTAALESQKYGFGGVNDIGANDAGQYPELYEVGPGVNRLPVNRYPFLERYFSFDEGSGATTYDGSGNGFTGTLVSSPAWQATSNCRVGNSCLSFNGSSQYVTLSDPVHYATDWTFSAIIRTSTANERMIGHSGGSDLRVSSGHLKIEAAGGGSLEGTLTINDGQWHRVTGVRQGNTLLIYVDGVLDVTGTTSAPFTMGVSAIAAREPGDTDALFNGTIDDVRIYSTALSQQSIQFLPF